MPSTQLTLRRILYAEDDPDIQQIARYALERLGGYELRLCASAMETLEQASHYAADLILLDARLPDMDGLELMQRLRTQETLVRTPVIFVTANVHEQELQRYREQGALDVITKPFNAMTLAKELAALWALYLASLSGSASP